MSAYINITVFLYDITSVDTNVLCDVLCRSLDTKMDLQSAVSDAMVATDLFFNNRFAESKNMFQKWYKHFKIYFTELLFGSI